MPKTIKTKPDILLINVGNTRKKIYQDLSKEYSAIDTPFWAALTAGYIRKKGYVVDLLDANALNMTHEETLEYIKIKDPEYVSIVVYSQQANVCTPIMVEVGNLCSIIKRAIPRKTVILSGWHPSALPERTLKEESCDLVIQGEGFHTYIDILSGKPKEKIKGLWWKEGGKIRHNERAPNIENLTEELSDVAWDLLPMGKGVYRAFNWMCLHDLGSRNRFASMFTSLGCPFRCIYCAIHATYGEHRLRCWSPEWVLEQFDILTKKYDVANVNLHDEQFIFKKDHYLPIAEGIVKRGYKLNIAAFARVDVLHKMPRDELQLLKKAGFNWFKVGIETPNEHILKRCKKGQFNSVMVKEAVSKLHKIGINLCANFMFGLPGDTYETMQKTLEFALELKCAFPSFFCTMAIPGSELYTYAQEKGLPLPDSWLGYASQGYEFLPLPTEDLTSADIVKFRDYAFERYFTDPDYLSFIHKTFGSEAVEHIKGMTQIKLKRKILGD